MRHKSLCKSAVVFILASLASGCTPERPSLVKTKVFGLNPKEYENVQVSLQGRIERMDPAQAYFVLEDDTGKIVVTTENLSNRLPCRTGQNISLTGALKSVEKAEGPYFSMESLVDCKP